MQQNYLLNQRGNIFKVINKGIGIINAVQSVFSAKAYFKACYGNAYNLEAIVLLSITTALLCMYYGTKW